MQYSFPPQVNFQGGNGNQYGLNGKHLAGKSKERCSENAVTVKRHGQLSCRGEGTHGHHPATLLFVGCAESKASFPYRNSAQGVEKLRVAQTWHSNNPKTSSSREMHNLVSTSGGSGRRNNLPVRRSATYHINHIAFTASSQSLSDTEIHPAALDKTSYHRAGDQLEVYVKHLPVTHLKQNKSQFMCVSAVKTTIPSTDNEKLCGRF